MSDILQNQNFLRLNCSNLSGTNETSPLLSSAIVVPRTQSCSGTYNCVCPETEVSHGRIC